MVYRFTFKVVVWVIIAIARLRFPVGQSIPTIICRRCNDNGPSSINNSFEFNKELLDQDASVHGLLGRRCTFY